MKDEPSTSIDSRRTDRVPLDAEVSVTFAAGSIVGSGKNISEQGLYFTADAVVPVTVHIDGHPTKGELVRFESMGNGKVGVAIRFVAT